MKRRTADPLAPLLPVARIAAVGLVAAGGSLAAVLAINNHTSAEPVTTTAKLVAAPEYARQVERTATSATFTDQAKIDRVAEIINGLPPAPTGAYACPADSGSGLKLDFESSSGTVLEEASMSATGCGGTTITIGGKQSNRASSRETVQEIQQILGTNWQLVPTMPG
jgi:hypothetical protein